MNNTDNSVERISSEQYRSAKLQEDQWVTLNLTDNINKPKKSVVFPKTATRVYWYIKSSHKRIFGTVLFTSIILAIVILAVRLTTAKRSKSSQSNSHVFQHNSNPRSSATGDFNHDNLLDIVVVNSGMHNIGIFLNYGTGAFTSHMTYNTGDNSRPLSVVLGDFNSDTHLDIAVANYAVHNIGIFRGYSDGTFANQTTFSTGASRPVSLALGDFNNDHWLDIVATYNDTNTIGIFFGKGDGYFGNQKKYSTDYDSLPNSVVVADFNNDYDLDIAVANYGTDNILVFLGYRNGSFTTQTTYTTNQQSRPYSIAANDFNNDGYLDLVVANSGTNNVGIFIGNGDGSFASQKTYSVSPESRPHSIIIGDFNQDNKFDLAVSNRANNNVSILIGYGNGSFATSTIYSIDINSGSFGMTAGDFDDDNKLDIAIVNFYTNNVSLHIEYNMIQSESAVCRARHSCNP